MKDCPPHQILNPATKRCVSRDGKIGRDILGGNISKKYYSPKSKKSVICPPHQILNPTTKRCVSRDGKIGRDILGNKKSKSAKPNKPVKSKLPKPKPKRHDPPPRVLQPWEKKIKCFNTLCNTIGKKGQKLTKKDFTNYLLMNHPDKNGGIDSDIVKEIISCWGDYKDELNTIRSC